jgi:hypothetical protein
MRRFLAIVMATLALAGCVGQPDKVADARMCESAMPPSTAVAGQLFPSNRLNVPSRNLLGGGKLDSDDTMTYACIDPANSKLITPQVPNPHKIRLDHLSDAI